MGTRGWFVWGVVLALLGGIAGADTCPYRDEWGDSRIATGGSLLANALAQIDPGGAVGIPGDYAAWDLNGDGIPDSVQFELLTSLLCLPSNIQHPTIDIAALKADFEANVARYWELVEEFRAKEAAIIAAAPLAISFGTQLRAAATTCGAQHNLLDPNIFLSGEIPPAWEGETYWTFGGSIRDVGNIFDELYNDGYIGSPLAILWLTLDNPSTSYLMAALLGMDSAFVNVVFGSSYVHIVEGLLELNSVDWDYLLGLFEGCGLDPTLVDDVSDALAATGLAPGLLPDPAELEVFAANGQELLNPNTQWGPNPEDTLGNLITLHGESIWEAVEDTFSPSNAKVRVVHAVSGGPAVDVCANGGLLVGGLAFGGISAYESVDVWGDYDVTLAASGAGCAGPAMATTTLDHVGDVTIVAMSSNAKSNVDLLTLVDDNAIPAAGKARLRFVHAVADAPAVTVRAGVGGSAAGTLFSAIPFQGVGGYIEIDPGIYTFQIQGATKGDALLPANTFALNAGAVYTLFALGGAQAPELLLSADSDLALVEIIGRNEFYVGETIGLTASVDASVSPITYSWSKDGLLVEGVPDTLPTLEIFEADMANSGDYTVMVEVELPDEKGAVVLVSASIRIKVSYPLPVGGALGLAAFAGLCALTGVFGLRRRGAPKK